MNKYTLMGIVAFSSLLLSPLAMAEDINPYPVKLRVFNKLDQDVRVSPSTDKDTSVDISYGTVIPANGSKDVNINTHISSPLMGSVTTYAILDFNTTVNGVDTHIGGYRYQYAITSGFGGTQDIYHDFWPTSTNQADSNWRVEPWTANAENVSCSGSDFQNCECLADDCYTELYIKTKQQQGD